MHICYLSTYWGHEAKDPADFLDESVGAGFSGFEINPGSGEFGKKFSERLAHWRGQGLKFIGQQVLENAVETPSDYFKRLEDRLEFLSRFSPDAINSHTGKDYFSFDDNCRAIDITEEFSARTGIPIYHETHRGRFSFHLQTLLPYLYKYQDLKLTADLSHFCTVSESLLTDQSDALQAIFPNVRHIHARIGSEQAPQVNDAFAPEWETHRNHFLNWWLQIVEVQKNNGLERLTITPEAGPFPYQPQHPLSCENCCDPWQTNLRMKYFLRQNLRYECS